MASDQRGREARGLVVRPGQPEARARDSAWYLPGDVAYAVEDLVHR